MMSILCHIFCLVASLLTMTRGETDGVTNQTAECSSSKSDVMEERKTLLRIFCPKEGDEDFKVVSRSVWAEGTGENTSDDEDLFRIYREVWEILENIREPTTLRRTKQADLLNVLIVNVHLSLVSNFFIENDGRIFEGLGWDNVNYFHSVGLGDRALMIAFADRRKQNPTPSEAAIGAYESLVRYAICTGKLSTDYKLIPYHLIWDLASYLGRTDPEFANYESNQMRDWNAYTDNVDFLFPPENEVDLPVVSREEWLGVRPNSTMYVENRTIALEHPVSRVVVSDKGPRCFRDCGKFLKWISGVERGVTSGWNVNFNFIITESGRVYEGLGWNHTYTWNETEIQRFGWNETLRGGVDQIYISIIFLGTFDAYSPRQPAFNALNKIIDEGLRNGKIISDYQINTMNREGNGLYQHISKMDRFNRG